VSTPERQREREREQEKENGRKIELIFIAGLADEKDSEKRRPTFVDTLPPLSLTRMHRHTHTLYLSLSFSLSLSPPPLFPFHSHTKSGTVYGGLESKTDKIEIILASIENRRLAPRLRLSGQEFDSLEAVST